MTLQEFNGSIRAGTVVCGLLVALAAPIPALAADDTVQSQLGEIVVLARKRSESLQDVPVAITALNAAAIEGKFSADLSDVKGMPNVVLDPAPAYANAAAFSIRGMSFQDPDASFEPAVGILLNGVFLGKANANLLDLYDVEQIEILRGPQGTLFGKNTIGGLVAVQSRRPSGEFHTDASVDIGNFGRRDVKASIEAPLGSDTLSFRLSGMRKRMDGYFYNLYTQHDAGAEDSDMGRLVAVWKPTASFDLTLIGDIVRDKGDASPERNASPPGTAAAAVGYPADTNPNLFVVNENGPNFIDSTTRGASLEANWRQDASTVTSITGLRHTDDKSAVNLAGTPVTLLEYPREQIIQQFSEELRIASSIGPSFDYVAGVMYFKEWFTQAQIQIVDCTLIGACPPAVPVGAVQVPLGAYERQNGESYAAFGQANYHITDRIRFTFGGRYSRETKDFNFNPPGYNLAPPAFAPFIHANATFDDFTPKLGFDFKQAEGRLWYVSYATGFKAGGFNGRANSIADIGPYLPEKVKSYEGGLKAEWLDKRLRTNVAVFYNRYTDMQVDVIIPSSVGAGEETLVRNAADAYTEGVELEATVLPVDGLNIHASLGYLRAHYLQFLANLTAADFAASGIADHTGLELRRAPEWNGALGSSYDIPAGAAGKWTLAADVSFTSYYQTDVTNDAFARVPGHALIDASVAYTPAGGWMRVALYGKNLANRQYINNGINAGGLLAFNEPNRPRVYGIDVSVKY